MVRRIAMLTLGVLAACEGAGQAVSAQEERPLEKAATAQQDVPRAPEPTPAAVVEPPQNLAPNPDQTDEPSPEAPEEENYVEPEPPEMPAAPEGYGTIKPPDPLPTEDQLTNNALVAYEVVAVYAKPEEGAPRLGYLRLGTRLKVTDKVEGTGCSGGWYGVPQGGYACAVKGRGLLVDAKKEPYMHHPPPPPRVDEGMPYDYAYVRKWNTPMFWRIPTKAEQQFAVERRAELEAERTGVPLPSETPAATPKPADAGAKKPADGGAKKPAEPGSADADAKKADDGKPLADLPKPPGDDAKKPDDAKPAEPKPADADAKKPEPKPADADAKKPEPKPAEPKPAAEPVPEEPAVKLPLNPSNPWLEKGYYVSLGDKVTEEGRTWWATARGGYVEAGAAAKVGPKSEYHGNELPPETDFPFGYAMAKTPQLVELTDDGKLKAAKKLERRTFLDLTDETVINGRAYMMTTDGQLILKEHVRFAERQPLPDGVQPWERWVDVDITTQILVAYEGERPVFTTLVSTGRKGTADEPFDTPTGQWRIRSKHVSTTMDGGTASDGNYSIQDVPWTMYFFDSYALHGAFWHDGFGRVRSHGCVNLHPDDARWLFNWTTPFLPEGWHGVHAHEGSEGTTVVVRKSDG